MSVPISVHELQIMTDSIKSARFVKTNKQKTFYLYFILRCSTAYIKGWVLKFGTAYPLKNKPIPPYYVKEMLLHL